MHIYLSSMTSEASPGLVLVVAAVLASVASHSLLRHATRGRARSALSYLCGLAAGLAATMLCIVFLRPYADPAIMLGPGILGSFFGPFIGMLRAKWEGPPKRRRRPDWMGSPSR
jgi:hypothetical protein